MRVLGLVPARGGSSRLPGKNLARLGGKTLVRRALETAVSAGCFDVVALSSDDDEILAEAQGLDVAPLRRPAELATDTALVRDVALHALRELDDASQPFEALAKAWILKLSRIAWTNGADHIAVHDANAE